RPDAGHDVVGFPGTVTADEDERDDRVLRRGPALHQEDLEMFGNGAPLPNTSDRFFIDARELLATVENLAARNATALPIGHFAGRLLKYFQRQSGGTRGKVPGTGTRLQPGRRPGRLLCFIPCKLTACAHVHSSSPGRPSASDAGAS